MEDCVRRAGIVAWCANENHGANRENRQPQPVPARTVKSLREKSQLNWIGRRLTDHFGDILWGNAGYVNAVS
jgi:hypothetical protein